MEVKGYSIDFTAQELAEWLEQQPPDRVVHRFPYSCGCTITTYLHDVTEGLIKSTAGSEAYTDSIGEEPCREYDLPDVAPPLMMLFDRVADANPESELTASKALEILNNTTYLDNP